MSAGRKPLSAPAADRAASSSSYSYSYLFSYAVQFKHVELLNITTICLICTFRYTSTTIIPLKNINVISRDICALLRKASKFYFADKSLAAFVADETRCFQLGQLFSGL